jgi:hypothetical protein
MKNVIAFLLFVAPVALFAQAENGKSFSQSVRLNTNVEQAWTNLIDFKMFKEWDSNIVDVRCQEELSENLVCQAIAADGKVFEVEITEWVPGQSYTLRTKLSSGNLYIKRSLEGKEVATLNETVWFKGISRKTFEKYKGSNYDQTIVERINAFKGYMAAK